MDATHKGKFINLLSITMENQGNIISKMTEQYNQYHNLLRGFNKVTGTMVEEKKVRHVYQSKKQPQEEKINMYYHYNCLLISLFRT